MANLIILCLLSLALTGCYVGLDGGGHDHRGYRHGEITAPLVTFADYRTGCNRNGHYCRWHHRPIHHRYYDWSTHTWS